MKEDCWDDPGWCFKAAVGDSLPASFHSYGQPSQAAPEMLQDVAFAIENMRLPSAADVMASAGEHPAPSSPGNLSSDGSLDSDIPIARGISFFEPLEFIWAPWKRSVSLPANTTTTVVDGLSLTPNQTAIAKGYSDGFMTAKLFAMQDMSKLGFMKQYVMDSASTLAPLLLGEETQASYADWFLQGLQEGQQVISTAVKPYR